MLKNVSLPKRNSDASRFTDFASGRRRRIPSWRRKLNSVADLISVLLQSNFNFGAPHHRRQVAYSYWTKVQWCGFRL
jgi:hypothetical protein